MKRGWTFLGLIFITTIANTGCNLLHRGCNNCNGPLGCRPCSIGWQRGGLDYQRYASVHSHPQDGGSGVGAAQVGYPYYTVRGPRDFLNPNPPSIGP